VNPIKIRATPASSLLPKVLLIQKWYRLKAAKARVINKLRVLYRFKPNLLAVYKGWLVR
jgi:hypothetical protein